MSTVIQPVRRDEQAAAYATKHVRFGFWSLFVFAVLGLALEMLHAFKMAAYLDVGNETRRLMWTLAHAHGTVLPLINIAYGLSLRAGILDDLRRVRETSWSLAIATILLPTGFFLGGVRFYSGDPGLAIVLVPVGAAALLVGLVFAATSFGKT